MIHTADQQLVDNLYHVMGSPRLSLPHRFPAVGMPCGMREAPRDQLVSAEEHQPPASQPELTASTRSCCEADRIHAEGGGPLAQGDGPWHPRGFDPKAVTCMS